MKTIVAILMLAGTSAFCCGDYSANKIVETHLKAIETGDKEMLMSAWAKNGAQVIEIKKGKASVKDINKTFTLWTAKKNPNLNGKILSITKMTDDLSVAKVSLNWQGVKYTEILTLSKKDNKWEIINKTYKVPKSAGSSYGI